MNYHWNLYLGKSVRNSLSTSSGIGVATGTFHRWKNTLTAKKWHLWRQEIHSIIPYPPHGHPGTTLERSGCAWDAQELLPWRAPRGAAAPEWLQPRKVPSLGQGGGSSVPEGLRGTDCSPTATPVPHGQSQEWRGGGGLEKTRRGGEMLFEYVCLCLTVTIYFNTFFFFSNLFCPWQ